MNNRFVLNLALTAGVFVAPLFAQSCLSWTLSTSGPSYLQDFPMVYDSDRQLVVAQCCGGGIMEWDGSTWVLGGGSGPPSGGGMMMTYDAAHHYCLLVDTNQGTWTWDGTTWTQLSPETKAPKATAARIVFDSSRNRAVFFCATGVSVQRSETWEWDGENWTQVNIGGPPTRQYAGMAFDSNRAKTVLFGGASGNGLDTTYGDTWEWDGQTWAQVSDTGPAARCYHAMSFDEARNVTVLFGGASEYPLPWHNPVFFADTWAWDGSNWTQLAITGPSARYSASMAYDGATEQNVYVGGTNGTINFNETWQLGANGPDCNGNGVPDACDIASGTSQDCNANGVPDECDLASGTSTDCNANGIPDECDIAAGTSKDSNADGIPDECQTCLFADLHPDGMIDLADVGILLANYGKTNVPPSDGDLDFDTDVDLTDVAIMLQYYGKTCP